MKTAIVTGGTSGLGLAAAQRLAEKGLRVYALSRHGAPVPGVTSLACDITDADAVERTVAAIEAEAGRIDLVVNNAGFGISGAVECTTPEEARRLFDVDFFGVVNVNHAVLPRMKPVFRSPRPSPSRFRRIILRQRRRSMPTAVRCAARSRRSASTSAP